MSAIGPLGTNSKYGTGKRIPIVPKGRPDRDAVAFVVVAQKVGGGDEAAAMAALFAAAPDLLALARQYRALHAASVVFGRGCSCAACARAEEVIAKAEGRS